MHTTHDKNRPQLEGYYNASISKERQGDTHTVFPGLPEETLRLLATNTQVYCISKQVS